MTDAAIAADVHETLDVHGHFTAKVTLHLVIVQNFRTKQLGFFFGKILDAGVGIDARLLQDLTRRAQTDAVDVRKADLDALVAGKIYQLPPSSLTLFMTRIAAADDADDAIALDHSAILTNGFNR